MSRFLPGERAPNFRATTLDYTLFDLEDRLRHRRVWLAFFRFAACPLCNLRLHELAEAWPRIRQPDVDMVAVFHSPHESIERWLTERRPPIEVIVDPERTLYSLFHVERSVAGMFHPAVGARLVKAHAAGHLQGLPENGVTTCPADFLIDKDGVFRDCYYGKTIADHIPLARVERYLAEPSTPGDVVRAAG